MLKNNSLQTKSHLSFMLGCFFVCALLCIASMESFAFSASLVTKADSVKDNLILIARACVGVGIVIFVFSLIVSRPMWKLCICLLTVGVILAAFPVFYNFVAH